MNNSTGSNSNFFADKTIGQKLTAAFAALVIITLIIGGIGYYGSLNGDTSIDEIGLVRLPSVQSIQNMNIAVVEVYAAQQALMNQDLTVERRTQIYKDIESGQEAFQLAQGVYEQLPQTENEAVLWGDFLETMEEWQRDNDVFLQRSRDFDEAVVNDGDYETLYTDLRNQFLSESLLSYNNMHENLVGLVSLNEEIAESTINSASSWSTTLRTANIIALILGVAIAVLFGYFITRSINSSLGGIIVSLTGGSDQVDSASQQLSESSQSMAESASEQAASLQETSSSLEEVSAQIKQTAQNSSTAEKAMKNAQPLVESGVQAMERMNDIMQGVKEASMETSKIIKTIDDIAFQTNLLALNAAVEAARAGEAGKGFAVVAEEVRNLAHRSAQAAKNTSEIIEKSQERSDQGLIAAEEVGENLGKISESVNDVSTLVVEISAASGEQATGIQQINTAMSEMDKTVQNNASNSEESASAAEELSSQAGELRDMIDQLVKFAGDSAQQSSGKRNQKQPRTVERSSVTYNDFQNSRFDKPSSKKTALKAQNGNNARDLIPLDDSDLSEF